MMLLLATLVAYAADSQMVPDYAEPKEKLTAQLQIVDGLVNAGMHQEALKAVTSLRETGVKDPRFDVLQARAMYGIGLSTEAEQVLRAHLRRHARDAEAWALLGLFLADGGKVDDSIDAFKHSRRLHPNDAGTLNNLGYVYLARGDLEPAIEMFRASLAIDPSQLRARNNLGFALARTERDSDALEVFRSAGSEADARYNMGVACELRGDEAFALTHYQAAITALPAHPEANAALARLLSKGKP